MDTGTGFVTGIKKGIVIHTRGTRIRVPGGYTVPVSITTLAYAVIRQVNLLDEVAGGIKYYKDLGSIVFVDLNQVKCVIGRILDRGKWAIIDRCTNILTQENVDR